jgi:hypothetical protein
MFKQPGTPNYAYPRWDVAVKQRANDIRVSRVLAQS